MKNVSIIFLSLIIGMATMGCGDDGTDGSDSTDNCKTSDKDGNVTVAGVNFTIGDWVSGGTLEGAQICGDKTDPVAGDLVVFHGSKDTFFPFRVEMVIPETAPAQRVPFVLAPDTIVDAINKNLEQKVDPEKGHLTISIASPADADGNTTSIPAAKVSFNGKAQVGPKYFNPTSLFALGMFGPDEEGTTNGGIGVYFNVDPGEVEAKIDVNGYTCKANTSGSDTDGGGIKITIEKGKVSYITVTCTPEEIEITTKAIISDFVSQAAIEGAVICVNDAKDDDCYKSNADGLVEGKFKLKLGDLMSVRIDAENYMPVLMQGPIRVVPDTDTDPLALALVPTSILGGLKDLIGAAADAEKGHAMVLVVGPKDAEGNRSGLEGVELSVVDDKGTGPKYINPLEKIAEGLFGADDAGTTSTGVAAVFNVAPGSAVVSASLSGHTCYTGAIGQSNANGATWSDIEAGRISYMTIICDK